MGLSTAVCNSILDFYLRGQSLTPPSTVYAALADANGTEPASGGYARVAVATSDWASASGGEIANTNAITFPAPTGDWGTMAKAKIFDAAMAGNELASGDMTEPVEVLAGGTTPSFIAGNFVVKFAEGSS